MNDKSPVMDQVIFDRPAVTIVSRWHVPSPAMAILIIVVAFLVLTPLALMILNSFQTARPGQPIVWGLEGWVKAFTTPGIIKAITRASTATSRVTNMARRRK